MTWRRRPHVVLWGGRPEIDYAYGSRLDRQREALIGVCHHTARRVREAAELVGKTLAPVLAVAIEELADFAASLERNAKLIREGRFDLGGPVT